MTSALGQSDPVERFAAEADDARTRIAATIDEIQDRLDPRRIVGDAVEKVSDTSTQLLGDARAIVTRHPITLGAAVAAIALAFLARRTLARATVNLGDDVGDYTDYDDDMGFVVEDGTRGAGLGDLADSDVRTTSRLRRGVVGARVGSAVAQSPVGAIAAGVAAGAALGALFPTTNAERQALGDVGARVGAAARAAMTEASGEFEAAGLSVTGLRDQVDTIGRTASRAAQSAMAAARVELRPARPA